MRQILLAIVAVALSAGAACAQAGSFGLRMIVVRTESEARDILSLLEAGERFEELARKRSIDRSAGTGGFIGTITISELRRELQDAVKGLRPGQVSPITTVGGEYVLLQLVKDEGAQRIALIEAATRGDTARLKEVLDAGASANASLDDGSPVLMAAAYLGQLDAVRILLNAGADGKARLDDGSTVLIKAALAGHADIVRVLIDAGANVNAKAKNGLTALMQGAFAGRLDVARILLNAGAEVNATLDNGSTALMAAALGGYTEIVRSLVAAGADVRAKAKSGSTALTEAVYKGQLDVAKILLAAGADVNASIENGSTALMAAALAGRAELVRELLDAGADVRATDKRGWTALTHAAASASSETVRTLLARDTGVSSQQAAVLLGSTYVNEFYGSREMRLLELAAGELGKALAAEPENLAALQWMAAVEVLQWGQDLNLEQFRTVNSQLKKCVTLAPSEPERHNWVAATNWIFASRGKGASAIEQAAIIDEGIAYARKAIELDTAYPQALDYLNLLYREKAAHAATSAERDDLLRTAESIRKDAAKVREASAGRPSRSDDQFSRPPAPPAP